MKFTKEQQNFIKNCGEHFEVLTGGRGHSKTKEVIEDLQQELEQHKNNWEELKRWVKKVVEIYNNVDVKTLLMVLDKMKELEENK